MRLSLLPVILSAACVLSASGVRAAEIDVPYHAGVSLRAGQVSASEGDMQVLSNALLAQNGVRVESGPAKFYPFATLHRGERYVVRGAHLTEYRVEVKALTSTAARLDVALRNPHEGEDPTLKAGYHLVGYQIADGAPSQPVYPDLRLYKDGTYRMGAAKGYWQEREGHLALDGYYEAWGVAAITPEQVVFKFPRMGLTVQATLERIPDAAAAQASR